jgi:hypothetical protein
MMGKLVLVVVGILMVGALTSEMAVEPRALVATCHGATLDSCVEALANPHDIFAKIKCAIDIAIEIWRNGEGSWIGDFPG